MVRRWARALRGLRFWAPTKLKPTFRRPFKVHWPWPKASRSTVEECSQDSTNLQSSSLAVVDDLDLYLGAQQPSEDDTFDDEEVVSIGGWKQHMRRPFCRRTMIDDAASTCFSVSSSLTRPKVEVVDEHGAIECIPQLRTYLERPGSKSSDFGDLNAADSHSIASALLAVSFEQDCAQLHFVQASFSEDTDDGSMHPLGIEFPHPAAAGETKTEAWSDDDDDYSKPPSPVIVRKYPLKSWDEEPSLQWSFSEDAAYRPFCRLGCGGEDHPYDEPDYYQARPIRKAVHWDETKSDFSRTSSLTSQSSISMWRVHR